jgi:hypothetical protein
VRDIEYSTIVPDAVAFRDYAFEPHRQVETGILDNVTVLPVILIDVGSSCQAQRLASCRYFSAGRKKNAKQLRTRNRRLRNDLQVLSIKPQLLTALGAIASVALNYFAWSLQLKPGVEEFAALGAQDSLRTQIGAEAS